MQITTATYTDKDGCVIASATRDGLTCEYDGGDYYGDGWRDEDLRYAARMAHEAVDGPQ